jgi:hypothetical protein
MKVIPKSYTVASCLTGVFLAPNLFIKSDFYIKVIIVSVILSLLSPLITKLSYKTRRRMVYSISIFYTLLIGGIIGVISFNLLQADSLSDFEGSNGEGAPIAIIIGLVMVTMLFFLPWLICSIRLLKGTAKSEQCASY